MNINNGVHVLGDKLSPELDAAQPGRALRQHLIDAGRTAAQMEDNLPRAHVPGPDCTTTGHCFAKGGPRSPLTSDVDGWGQQRLVVAS